MITSKAQNYECCMCGDHGLSFELFRCKVCHFRSQHRYCSNLYPKAETYRVCNWCLIQKDEDDHDKINSSNSSSPIHSQSKTPTSTNYKKPFNTNNNNINGPKSNGPSPKCLQPTSPIKKPARSPENGSPAGRKRIMAGNGEEKAGRKSKSSASEDISNNNNYNNRSTSSRSSGGPAVIKHVFRNKVRRYKLLEEVSS